MQTHETAMVIMLIEDVKKKRNIRFCTHGKSAKHSRQLGSESQVPRQLCFADGHAVP
jgi:hypothetical protein